MHVPIPFHNVLTFLVRESAALRGNQKGLVLGSLQAYLVLSALHQFAHNNNKSWYPGN